MYRVDNLNEYSERIHFTKKNIYTTRDDIAEGSRNIFPSSDVFLTICIR